MGYFTEKLVGGDSPSVKQAELCRDLLYDVVRGDGKDVKVSERYPGRAFLLPRGLVEYTAPDTKRRVRIERDRNYAASIQFGDAACKLIILETESWLIGPDSNEYRTDRNVYRVEWNAARVIDSQCLRQEMISPATTFGAILPHDFKDYLALEVVAEQNPEEDISPWFRCMQHGLLTDDAVTQLLDRIEMFGRDAQAARGLDYTDET